MDEGSTMYERVGGSEWFVGLVDRFYEGVERSAILRPLYPEEDLGPARERLAGFLIQYWGGPTDYSDQRGHPRLRMRHFPFVIGERERDEWLRLMTDALEEGGLDPDDHAEMLAYFTTASTAMINHRPDGLNLVGPGD